jgi:oligopeptide transport system permease protein
MSGDALAPAGIESRSLWQEAFDRFLANRAALAGLAVLAAIAAACLAGPPFTGHPYDRVYRDYVRVPARLASYPTPQQVEATAPRLAARMRASLECLDLAGEQGGYAPSAGSDTRDGGRNAGRCAAQPGASRAGEGDAAGRGRSRTPDVVRLVLTSPRPIDERLLAYVERSDLFGPARVLERAEEGRRLVVAAPVAHTRFLFGTDANGRDLLTRTLVAGRVSLAIGLLASLVALSIGVGYGALAGYLGGRTDLLMMRLVDVLYALPFMFFVILLVVFFGRNFILMFVAVGAIEWLDMARIVRGQTLSIRRQEYVQAAEALGVGTWGMLRRHIVPNLLGPVIVYLTLLVPKVILLESFLSFLGLGVQEPMTGGC